MEQQRVALIGLAGVGGDYLAALRSEDGFDLVAVADANREVLRQQVKPASGGSLRVYEDYRSLIVETAHAGLDLLFVALEPFQSIEFVELAASRGIGVFHKAPFARNVEEAKRVIGRFDANGCPLIVSRGLRIADCGLRIDDQPLSRQTIRNPKSEIRNPQKNLSELIGHVHAAAVIVRTADAADGWRGDRARAGGGVLLNGAYEQLDMLISLLGVPESVYAQCSLQGAPGAVRKYDTEDAATLSLRFTGDRTASVTVWRGAPDPGWNVTLVGADGAILLSESGMSLVRRGEQSACGTDSPVGQEAADRLENRPHTPGAAAVDTVRAARTTGNRPPLSTARDHLKTLAVIEAAYLSAKTGSPETPTRFLT